VSARRRRGVSVLEVLIAASVLAFGLVPILGSIQSASKEARLLELHTQALARARGQLEAARVLGPRVLDQLLAGKTEATVPVALPRTLAPEDKAGEVTLVGRMGRLQESVTVKVLDRQGPAALYLLRSRITWVLPSEERQPHSVEVSTMLASPLTSINDPPPVAP
jgi:hypothetical protein